MDISTKTASTGRPSVQFEKEPLLTGSDGMSMMHNGDLHKQELVASAAQSNDEEQEKTGLAKLYQSAQEAGLIRFTVWVSITIVITVLGAWAYRFLESDNDLINRENAYNSVVARLQRRDAAMEELKKALANRGRGSTLHTYNNSLGYKDNLRLLIEAYEVELGINTDKPVMDGDRWTFQNSMFFCCSLYNSIGFGNRLYPLTTPGQVVTMIYSFIGIPFMLAMTTDLGLVVFDGIYWGWWIVIQQYRRLPYAQKSIQLAKERSENVELVRKELATFPVYLGIVMSVLSLAFCSGVVLWIEPTWTFFNANYYFVTSFLTIGLGDIAPSAPKSAPEWTLLPHTILLIFCMTFIGMIQHVLNGRIELVYLSIENAIHMHFRDLQDAGGYKQKEMDDIHKAKAANGQIGRLAGKQGLGNRLYFAAMDQSRSRLLQEIWLRKANMKNANNQTNAPKRDVGCQHLQPIDDQVDISVRGDYIGKEYEPKIKEAEDIKRVKYVYNIE